MQPRAHTRERGQHANAEETLEKWEVFRATWPQTLPKPPSPFCRRSPPALPAALLSSHHTMRGAAPARAPAARAARPAPSARAPAPTRGPAPPASTTATATLDTLAFDGGAKSGTADLTLRVADAGVANSVVHRYVVLLNQNARAVSVWKRESGGAQTGGHALRDAHWSRTAQGCGMQASLRG